MIVTEWQARHGLSASQYQQEFDLLVSQGYRLVKVSGYPENNEARFAGIWQKEEEIGGRQDMGFPKPLTSRQLLSLTHRDIGLHTCQCSQLELNSFFLQSGNRKKACPGLPGMALHQPSTRNFLTNFQVRAGGCGAYLDTMLKARPDMPASGTFTQGRPGLPGMG